MSVNLGIVSTGQKVVVLNPADQTQCRKYSGSGAPAWVLISGATFTECAVAPTTVDGNPCAVVPSLPAESVDTNPVRLYGSSATAFADTFVNRSYVNTTTDPAPLALQLAEDVAEVEDNKDGIRDDFNILGVQGTFPADDDGDGSTPAGPVFSPAEEDGLTYRSFSDQITVAIFAGEGATIRYTLNGTDPRDDGALVYSAPFTLTKSTQVRAASILDDTPSAITRCSYAKRVRRSS